MIIGVQSAIVRRVQPSYSLVAPLIVPMVDETIEQDITSYFLNQQGNEYNGTWLPHTGVSTIRVVVDRGGNPAYVDTGLYFDSLDIPAGVTIAEVYLRVAYEPANAWTGGPPYSVLVEVDSQTNPPNYSDLDLPSDRTFYETPAQIAVIEAVSSDTWDLSPLIPHLQERVDAGDYSAAEHFAFRIRALFEAGITMNIELDAAVAPPVIQIQYQDEGFGGQIGISSQKVVRAASSATPRRSATTASNVIRLG